MSIKISGWARHANLSIRKGLSLADTDDAGGGLRVDAAGNGGESSAGVEAGAGTLALGGVAGGTDDEVSCGAAFAEAKVSEEFPIASKRAHM